jgi:hypothetical protein
MYDSEEKNREEHSESRYAEDFEKVRAVLHQLEFLKTSLARIESSIIGDPNVGQLGLVARINLIEKTQVEHERKFLTVHVTYGVIATAVALGLAVAKLIWH